MPIVPIVAAGLAWAGAATAVGTLTTVGIAGLTITEGLSIVAAVGATIGAVGAVTGDKGLLTAGMIIGGIGGIGQLAVSAGIFGEGAGATTLFGDAAVPSSVAITAENPGFAASAAGSNIVDSFGGTSGALPDVTGGASSASVAGGAAGDTLNDASAAADATRLQAVKDATAVPTEGIGVTQKFTQLPVAPVPVAPPLGIPTAPVAPATPSAFDQSITAAGGNVAPVAPTIETPGILGSLGNFIKNDKSGMVGYGLIQAGGSLIGGLFDPLKPAQVSALNAQTAQQQAQTGITNTQAANIKAPLPVASRPGLINNFGGI